MAKKEATKPVDLPVMVGIGDDFKAKGKSYEVKPLLLAHIPLFMKDNISLDVQIFNMTNEKAKKTIDKWLSEVTTEVEGKKITAHYCLDENGEPMSLDKVMADGWDLADLRNFFKKLCDISG